jgi:hypothetical protein
MMGSADEAGTNEEDETSRSGFDLQTMKGEIAKPRGKVTGWKTATKSQP